MPQANFFHLGSGKSTEQLAEWVQDEMDLESVTCPLHEEHQRPGRRLTDISVSLPTQTVGDVVWTWQSECLISDKVLEIFRTKGLTGFDVKPVKASFKESKTKPPKLWELIVTGWAGIAPAESGIRLIQHCSACGQNIYSAWTRGDKLVDVSQWDGKDFFIVWPLPRHILVTQKVANSIRESSISGVVLKPVNELVFPTSVVPRLSPGRLSYHMPEKRASELGSSLGIY